MATRDELVKLVAKRYARGDRAEKSRIVGYRRLEGLEAAAALAQLYSTVRLFVNFFQPSFKLAGKERDGARVRKRYHPAATPCQRLLAVHARLNRFVPGLRKHR